MGTTRFNLEISLPADDSKRMNVVCSYEDENKQIVRRGLQGNFTDSKETKADLATREPENEKITVFIDIDADAISSSEDLGALVFNELRDALEAQEGADIRQKLRSLQAVEKEAQFFAEEQQALKEQALEQQFFEKGTGFFYPYPELGNEETKKNLPLLILNHAKKLSETYGVQKIVLAYPTSQEEAEGIETAYQNGERIISSAISNETEQAKIVKEIEELLKTDAYKDVALVIAPISVSAQNQGKGRAEEADVKVQLDGIQQALDQGHVVFSMTDIPGKLFSSGTDPGVFPQALDTLVEQSFRSYAYHYRMPPEVRSTLLPSSRPADEGIGHPDQEKVSERSLDRKDVDALKAKAKADVDFLLAYLADPRRLKIWPLLPPTTLGFAGDDNDYFAAITLEKKQNFLIDEIKADYRGTIPKGVQEQIDKIISSKSAKEDNTLSDLSINTKLLAQSYIKKLDKYINNHSAPGVDFSGDLTSTTNRVKLASALSESLKDLKSDKEFIEIIESAESYAIKLGGTRSKLQPILNDLVWEANLLIKDFPSVNEDDETILKPNLINIIESPNEALATEFPDFPEFEGEEDSEKGAMSEEDISEEEQEKVDKKTQQAQLREDLIDQLTVPGNDAEIDAKKVNAVRDYLSARIKEEYKSGPMTFKHSKTLTAERLQEIKTSNLSELRMILYAELKGQLTSGLSGHIPNVLKDTINIINETIPPISNSRIREFSELHSANLLQYINQRETSLNYKLGVKFKGEKGTYASKHTRKHIQVAGEIAHAILMAQTQEELHRTLSQAAAYKTLLKENPKTKGSDLIKIIDDMEKHFYESFRHRPLQEQRNIEDAWREEFGHYRPQLRKEENPVPVSKPLQGDIDDLLKVIDSLQEQGHGVDSALIDLEIGEQFRNYLNRIQTEWASANDPLELYENGTIEKNFYEHINTYLKNNEKSIEALTPEEMGTLLFNSRLQSRLQKNIDVLVDGEPRQKLHTYFNEIKEAWAAGNWGNFSDPSAELTELFNSDKIGKSFYYQIKKHLESSDYKIIKDLTLQEMEILLLTTTKPKIFSESESIKDWSSREFELMGDLPRKIRGVTVYAKTTMNPTNADIIPKNNLPTCDLYFVDGALLEERTGKVPTDLRSILADGVSLKNYKKDKTKFDADILKLGTDTGAEDYDWKAREKLEQAFSKKYPIDKNKYKILMKNRILPCLLSANADHPEGFVWTTPVLGGFAFAGPYRIEVNQYFIELLKEMIQENRQFLPNLKGVVCTVDPTITVNSDTKMVTKNAVYEPEHIGNLPFIRTSQKAGLCPQSQYNAEVYSGYTEEKRKELSTYSTVGFVASDRGSILGNDANGLTQRDGKPKTQEGGVARVTNLETLVTGEPGEFDDKTEMMYLPKNKPNWKHAYYDYDDNAMTRNDRTWNVGNIINVALSTKEKIDPLQRQAYQLLNQKPVDAQTQICMVALTDALLESKSKSNRQLGKRLSEKIGPSLLDYTRHNYPTLYYTQYCLARLEEVKAPPELKNKLQGQLTDLIEASHKAKDVLPPEPLRDAINATVDEISDKKTTKGKSFLGLFAQDKYADLNKFLVKFNHDFTQGMQIDEKPESPRFSRTSIDSQ